jgi:hypothetical protein
LMVSRKVFEQIVYPALIRMSKNSTARIKC